MIKIMVFGFIGVHILFHPVKTLMFNGSFPKKYIKWINSKEIFSSIDTIMRKWKETTETHSKDEETKWINTYLVLDDSINLKYF